MTVLAPVRAPAARWDPTEQQFVEGDTTFLLDLDSDAAAGLVPGTGALLNNFVVMGTTPGKFRTGLIAPVSGNGNLNKYISAHGLLGPDQFTVEWWGWVTDQDLSVAGTSNSFYFWSILGQDGGLVEAYMTAGKLQASLKHFQNPAAIGTQVNVTSPVFTSGEYPAGTKVSMALTLRAGVLVLYVNGSQVGQKTGFVPPTRWQTGQLTNHGQGLVLLGNNSASNVGMSDLRISRAARVPGLPPSITSRSTITVDPATVVSGGLLEAGVVKVLPDNGTDGDPHNPLSIADQKAIADGVIDIIKVGSALNGSPIKAGAPDATHPSAGQSGAYSYDWQMLDRTLDYIVNKIGCRAYMAVGSCPQLLGGNVAPQSGDDLLTAYLGNKLGFASEVPNDLVAFGKMSADMVYRAHVELGYTLDQIPIWSLWNEPDAATSWDGTQADWLDMFNAASDAIVALGLGVELGGPEISNWANSKGWIQALIHNCATTSRPLPFVSHHYYSDEVGEPDAVQVQVDAWAAADSVAPPLVFATENGVQAAALGWPYQVDAPGPGETIYSLRMKGQPTGGTLDVSVAVDGGSEHTATLPRVSTAAAVQTALGALPNVGVGNVTVSGALSSATGVVVTFKGALAGHEVVVTADPSGLTGGVNTAEIVQVPVTEDFTLNDHLAGWMASSMIRHQKAGYGLSLWFLPLVPFFSDDEDQIVRAAYNVFLLWHKLGPELISATADSGAVDPGFEYLATKDPSTGRVAVLIASLHMRIDRTYPTLLELPGIADDTSVTLSMIDRFRSNSFDAGPDHAELETANGLLSGPVFDGKVGVRMPARGVALLEIG